MKEVSVEEINRMMLDQEEYDGLAEAVEELEKRKEQEEKE